MSRRPSLFTSSTAAASYRESGLMICMIKEGSSAGRLGLWGKRNGGQKRTRKTMTRQLVLQYDMLSSCVYCCSSQYTMNLFFYLLCGKNSMNNSSNLVLGKNEFKERD